VLVLQEWLALLPCRWKHLLRFGTSGNEP